MQNTEDFLIEEVEKLLTIIKQEVHDKFALTNAEHVFGDCKKAINSFAEDIYGEEDDEFVGRFFQIVEQLEEWQKKSFSPDFKDPWQKALDQIIVEFYELKDGE